MSKKPRQKHLGNAYVRVEQKYKEPKEVKKDKPWKKERGTFDNIDMSDLMAGFSNKGLAKKFSKHKYREYMA